MTNNQKYMKIKITVARNYMHQNKNACYCTPELKEKVKK